MKVLQPSRHARRAMPEMQIDTIRLRKHNIEDGARQNRINKKRAALKAVIINIDDYSMT